MLSPTPASHMPDPAITTGPPADEAGGILTVDLSALEANYKTLRSASVPAECAAVVKADGYGLGLEQVAGQLVESGCTTFFVADLSEGKRLRKVAPRAAIYILNGLPQGTGQIFADHNLRPVIGSSAELAEWDAFSGGAKWEGGFALHVDTGMNRLGVSVEEAAAIAPRINTENHGLKLIMSHFVASQFVGEPAQRGTDARVPQCARAVPRRAGLDREFVRDFPRRLRPSRPGAAGRGALRRQPDARQAESDEAGGRTEGADRQAARRRVRRNRRL